MNRLYFLLMFVFISIFLYPNLLLFAQTSIQGTSQQSGSSNNQQSVGGSVFQSDMNTISIVVLLFALLGLFASVVVYMFALAFSIDNVKRVVKGEMIEIIATVLLLVFLLVLIGILDITAQEISKHVARSYYGLTDPDNQKIVFNVDTGNAFNSAFTKASMGSALLRSVGSYFAGGPAFLAVQVIGSTVLSGRSSVFTNPAFSYSQSGYLTMTISPKDYRLFAEGILRKNIFCTYILWSYARRVLVPLSIMRSASYESGGFDPSTGAALQIPIDIIKKIGPVASTLAMFQYVLIHLLRLSTVFAEILIPIGLILRTNRFFRPAGGFILAVAITLYIFFPISVVVFMGNSKAYASKCAMPPVPTFDVDPCKPIDISFILNIGEYLRNHIDEVYNSVTRAFEMVNAMWQETLTGFLAMLVSLFSLMRALSGIFGSDIAEIGRGLIKFV